MLENAMPNQIALREQAFRGGLAEAIRSRKRSWANAGPDFVREISSGTGQGNLPSPDILIDHHLSPPLAIDVSWNFKQAEAKSRRRLGTRSGSGGAAIHSAIAVRIPPEFIELNGPREIKAHLLEGRTVDYALLQGPDIDRATRWPGSGLIGGGLDDIVAALPAVCQSSESISRLAVDVTELIKRCANRIEARTTLACRTSIATSVQASTSRQGLTTISVLWLNALLSQNRLSKLPGAGVPTLSACKNSSGCPFPGAIESTWRIVLAINFRAIFAPALDALRRVIDTDSRAAAEGLAFLFKAVERIENARLGSYIDVGAELFPRLSADRKTSAAFYTRPATAEFLACLTIRDRTGEPGAIAWGDPALGRRVRIADTACGTGTLVRAGYRQIRNLHERHGGNVGDLHRDFMERGVVAVDISAIAAHLTATSLSAMEPFVPYGDVQIGCVPVGGPDRTGSLEFLAADEVGDLFQRSFKASCGREDKERVTSASLPSQSLDFFLANPPYSRTRGGQSLFDVAGLPDAERKAMQRRAQILGRRTCANLSAGLATFFLAMADRKLRVGGRLGFVLPLTMASAQSYRSARRMIERRYTNVIALTVAGGAVGDESLSSDTGLSEMLLVAQKGPPERTAPTPVLCVNLDRGLAEIGHARETARAVGAALDRHPEAEQGEVRVGGQRLGTWVRRRDTGTGDPWSELGAAHSDLAVAAAKLARGALVDFRTGQSTPLPVPMVALEECFEVGPTHHCIGHLVGNEPIGAFEFHPLDEQCPEASDSSLWKASAKEQNGLLIQATHRGLDPPSPDREQQARMRAKASTLFYARNLRWTSQALLVAATEHRAMGGRAWTALLHDDRNLLKAFALWANSTLGLIVHWTQGGKQQPGRALTQVGTIRTMPVPDLARLPPERLQEASHEFDRLKRRRLLPACQAHADPIRTRLDDAVLALLGLTEPDGIEAFSGGTGLRGTVRRAAESLRNAFSREPQIHGKNSKALESLRAVGEG